MAMLRAVSIGSPGLPGDLVTVPGAGGIVLFAHGSGSSRLSPRNRAVAERLQRRGLDTLLFDLLDEREAADRSNVFDIGLLAARVGDAIGWVRRQAALAPLAIGLFGASTGAAAALRAAAADRASVSAVVSRGGRPDLALDELPRVAAPTLLIVGGRDAELIAPHRAALAQLRCEARLVIVPGASHLFEEAGAMDEVARLAGDWFAAHLAGRSAEGPQAVRRKGGRPPGDASD